MTLLSHPQVEQWMERHAQASTEAERQALLTAILSALQAGEGLDWEKARQDAATAFCARFSIEPNGIRDYEQKVLEVGVWLKPEIDRQHKTRMGALREALLAVGIGYIDGEGWYYTCEPHGEVPSEDGSLLAALRATMALKDEIPAPQMPDKYEETLVAYRKVNSELTEEVSALRQEIATLRARVQELEAVSCGYCRGLKRLEPSHPDRLPPPTTPPKPTEVA